MFLYSNVTFSPFPSTKQNTDMSPESRVLFTIASHMLLAHKTLLVYWYKFKFNFVFPRCFCFSSFSLSHSLSLRHEKEFVWLEIFPKAFTLIYAFDSFFPVCVASFANTLYIPSHSLNESCYKCFYFFLALHCPLL